MKTHTEHEMGHLVYVISQADVHSFFLHCKNQRVGQYLYVNKCNVFKSSRQFGYIEIICGIYGKLDVLLTFLILE